MDKLENIDLDANPMDLYGDYECPVCHARAKALVGREEGTRKSSGRIKCRKCDASYWENQGTGMMQWEVDDLRSGGKIPQDMGD
ncbi:MAG: hypothetical protein LIQ31_15290 [Planctomycetes bacterium]|nr:hypothetical protein [Planctomycetota bacterium]